MRRMLRAASVGGASRGRRKTGRQEDRDFTSTSSGPIDAAVPALSWQSTVQAFTLSGDCQGIVRGLSG